MNKADLIFIGILGYLMWVFFWTIIAVHLYYNRDRNIMPIICWFIAVIPMLYFATHYM